MDIELKLKYNPLIRIDNLLGILERHFPEYSPIIQKDKNNEDIVLLTKSLFVRVIISISHDEDNQLSSIGISGSMSSIAMYLFGFMLHYLFRGSILFDVAKTLKEELKDEYNIEIINF